MKGITGYVLGAVLLTVVGIGFLTYSMLEREMAGAQERVATFQYAGLEETLEAATSHALRIVGAARARGSIASRDRPGESLVHLSDNGTLDPGAAWLLAAVEPLHHPIRLARGEVDRHPILGNLPDEERELARGGWLVVPLADMLGGATGAIQLFDKSYGDFTENDEALLALRRVDQQLAQLAHLASDQRLRGDPR